MHCIRTKRLYFPISIRIQFEGTDDDEGLESVGNDVEEESGLGGNGNKEELVVGKYKKQLPNVIAAPAALTGQLQHLNFQLTLNAALIGDILSALHRIGAGLQPMQTVVQPMLPADLKPPAVTKSIRPKAIVKVKQKAVAKTKQNKLKALSLNMPKDKMKSFAASSKMALTTPESHKTKMSNKLTSSLSKSHKTVQKIISSGITCKTTENKSGNYLLACYISISFLPLLR